MNLDTFATDLSTLSDAELERVQLWVNQEVAVRIQNERLSKRLESAVIEAQGVGYTDGEIASVIEEAKVNARRGKRDPDADLVPMPTPGGESFTPPPAEQPTTTTRK